MLNRSRDRANDGARQVDVNRVVRSPVQLLRTEIGEGRALTAPAEDPGSVPSTCTVAHNHL